MPGAPLRLGPFTGGLNTASDPTAIGDAELVECENFELDIDGSLISRTPIQEHLGHIAWTERVQILGEAIFSGIHYLIGSNANGVFQYANGVWTTITNTFRAAVAVQYADFVYLVPHPSAANPGGKWNPVGGFTAVAAIPKGQAAVVHKERLFVVPGVDSGTNTSRLIFSNAGNFDTWTGTDFIDVGQGDGTKLIDVTVFQDNLLLFKNQSTYVLSYDVRPTDAVVRKISLTIGVNGQYNMVNYENQVYIFHNGSVYEIINFDFNRINTKVPFIRDTSVPPGFNFSTDSVFLSLLGDRLICRFYKKVYVYGLRTRTWSEWSSSEYQLQYFGPIQIVHHSTGDEYYAGSALQEFTSFVQLYDEHPDSQAEQRYLETTGIQDTFTRTVSNGWGAASPTGQTWITSGGAASDYNVTGFVGTHTLTSASVDRVCSTQSFSADIDVSIVFNTNQLATGAAQVVDLFGRYLNNLNEYFLRVSLNTSATVTATLTKRVAGVQTNMVTLNAPVTHVASTNISARFKIVGTRLMAKVWLTSTPEPVAWLIDTYDSTFTLPGSVGIRSIRAAGNTNAGLVITYDDYLVKYITDTEYDISCVVRTKNYDMAVSHQFKRLWWWGADISTSRAIQGTASPIVMNFQVYWGDVSTVLYWGDLLDNYWGQPLSTPVVVDTLVPTESVVARQFVKFNKSLRYRQINFMVELLTKGAKVDGPAKLFTMTIITETKQVVPESVN